MTLPLKRIPCPLHLSMTTSFFFCLFCFFAHELWALIFLTGPLHLLPLKVVLVRLLLSCVVLVKVYTHTRMEWQDHHMAMHCFFLDWTRVCEAMLDDEMMNNTLKRTAMGSLVS